MRWLSPWAFCLLCLASDAASTESTYPTPEETRREFEAVCQRLKRDSLFLGEANMTTLTQKAASTTGPPLERARIHGELGWELVRLDRLQEAIAQLELALELAEASPPSPEATQAHRRVSLTLAMAHLLLGEEQNCVENHSARSCILPFTEEALHQLPEQARQAGDLLSEHLTTYPDDVQARWLLNLARMVSGDYPQKVPAPYRLPEGTLTDSAGLPAWTDRARDLGVDVFDLAGGAVMEDIDGDGLLDLVSSSFDPCLPLRAFRNDGQGGFVDVTTQWGLASQLGGLNLLHADFDNDGAPDLLVLRGAWLGSQGRVRNSLLRNDLEGSTGRFVDVTVAAGLAYPAYPTQAAAWADYDGDGDLDLLVGNESTFTSTDPLRFLGGGERNFPTQLFRNNGDRTFSNVTRTAGIDNRRFAKSVAWGDVDNDGDPDAYISNFGVNRLYRNQGDGTFADVAERMGVTEPSRESFASWFFDYNNDGRLDLLVADYGSHRQMISASYLGQTRSNGHPILYRNDVDRFTDVSAEVGLDRPLLPMGANFGDLDNDGWLDFYLGTGVPEFEGLMPNVMYRNLSGTAFADVTFGGGFGHLQKGHGVAFGDLDNDGDQDLFHQLGGFFPCDAFGNAMFENPGSPSHWIVLRLRGRRANRSAIGTRIEIRARQGSTLRSIHRVVGTGGSFGSSSLQAEIGLGAAEVIEEIILVWPGSGARQVFRNVEPDRFYRATENEDRLQPLHLPRIELSRRAANPNSNHHHEVGSMSKNRTRGLKP